MRKISLLILVLMLVASKYSYCSEAIAVWAYPDSVVVAGTIYVGVVAYHSSGINRVTFRIDGGELANIRQESINPETNEYEFVFVVDTTELTDDASHTVRAIAYPNSGEFRVLPNLIIQVDNTPEYKTWYVAQNGDDVNGDGSAGKPFGTIGRALGTEWATPEPHAHSGDTVIVRAGTYALPQDHHAKFTKYVTVKAEEGAQVTISGGGALRTSFMKFVGIHFTKNGIAAYRDHIWIKDCTYTGYGQIWPDTHNQDDAFRSRNVGDLRNWHAVIENFTVHDANQGIMVIAQGNSIIRNCYVYNISGDAIKFAGENVLITGNRVHNVGAPAAWSVSKNNAPYNFGANSEFTFHISVDYGNTYSSQNAFSLNVSGDGLSAQAVVDQLNANSQFSSFEITLADNSKREAGLVAEISQAPYPHSGNIRIYLTPGRKECQLYVEGIAKDVLNLSDNTRSLNDISQTNPAKNSSEHCDFIDNSAGDISNIIIRNNKACDMASQGIKFGSIPNGGESHVYKRDIAIVNNQITGGLGSARHLYFEYIDTGVTYIHYENILLANNTVFRVENNAVKSVITLDMNNTYIRDFTIKNNIIGEYNWGDWKLAESGMGICDYNLFFPSKYAQAKMVLNSNSVIGEPFFINQQAWDFRLSAGSPAIGIADPGCGILYDLNWQIRSPSPEAGAFEFDPVASLPPIDDQADDGADISAVPGITALKCYNNVINPAKGQKASLILEVAEDSHASIIIYDSRGKKIKLILDEHKDAGSYPYSWGGEKDSGGIVGSGIYMVHTKCGGYKEIKKIAVVK